MSQFLTALIKVFIFSFSMHLLPSIAFHQYLDFIINLDCPAFNYKLSLCYCSIIYHHILNHFLDFLFGESLNCFLSKIAAFNSQENSYHSFKCLFLKLIFRIKILLHFVQGSDFLILLFKHIFILVLILFSYLIFCEILSNCLILKILFLDYLN